MLGQDYEIIQKVDIVVDGLIVLKFFHLHSVGAGIRIFRISST
jgi:hypothetical protein